MGTFLKQYLNLSASNFGKIVGQLIQARPFDDLEYVSRVQIMFMK
jgi:hypothetical protein